MFTYPIEGGFTGSDIGSTISRHVDYTLVHDRGSGGRSGNSERAGVLLKTWSL